MQISILLFIMLQAFVRRWSGHTISVLDSGLSGLGSSPGWGHCVVFLGKMLHSQFLSLPCCINGYQQCIFNAGGGGGVVAVIY